MTSVTPPPGAGAATVGETCWCGREPRGWVAAEGDIPMHRCRDCSAEHCEQAAIEHMCQFGLCRREAEVELTVSASIEPLKVCGLHVAPVLGWGVPEAIEPRIRYLAA